MLRFQRPLTAVLLLSLVAWLGAVAGCGNQPAPIDPHEGHDHDAMDETSGAHAEALASLSAEDRALAEKQKICPVTGQPLGSMGTPVKVTVEGRDVLLCCQGCVSAIETDPRKYLEKLPE